MSDRLYRILNPKSRGAVVEWVEWLGYDVGSRRKVLNSRLGFAMRRLENSNQRKIRQRKKRDGIRVIFAVSKIQWDSNPHCPYGY